MGYIKNINNAYFPSYSCGSLYEHWCKFSDQWLICCGERNCTNPIFRAVPVQVVDDEDDKWYVVPLCRNHAQSQEILDIGNVQPVEIEVSHEVSATKKKA